MKVTVCNLLVGHWVIGKQIHAYMYMYMYMYMYILVAAHVCIISMYSMCIHVLVCM